MKTGDWIEITQQSHMHTYQRFPIVFHRGRGMRLWDDSGREYIDFIAGLGVVNLGHSVPEVVAAISKQAKLLVHVSNLFYTEPQARLADTLRTLSGGACFFANSGAEANEGAVKLARRWGRLSFQPEKTDFVTATNSFHGRTLAMLAATGQSAKTEQFAPLPSGFHQVPFNDIDALETVITDRTCAVMLEVIQGEGGVWPAQAAYMNEVRKLCDARELLLILDEVQTGVGRTGRFFAFEHYGIVPDIVTIAKALANGLPVGAFIARDEVAEAFVPGDHGSTFGGGPLVTAAALATLSVLENQSLTQRAAKIGDYFLSRLKDLAAENSDLYDVRGKGLMIGASLRNGSARKTVSSLLEQGFIINNIGDSILRFLPPLIVEESEIDDLVGQLAKVLTQSA